MVDEPATANVEFLCLFARRAKRAIPELVRPCVVSVVVILSVLSYYGRLISIWFKLLNGGGIGILEKSFFILIHSLGVHLEVGKAGYSLYGLWVWRNTRRKHNIYLFWYSLAL
jgi:hypothetical protein